MGTPHKHAEVIKAWADGSEVQFRIRKDCQWADVIEPSWDNSCEYRIKPQTIKYRVALIKGKDYCHTSTANYQEDAEFIESWSDFLRWLTDWVEVEV